MRYENNSKDHWVPQWLLRNWCGDDNQLWLFDKMTGEILKSGTRAIAQEPDFYKSDLFQLDLEATVFQSVDASYSQSLSAFLLLLYWGQVVKRKRVPDYLFDIAINLMNWTALRSKRSRAVIDPSFVRDNLSPDDIMQAVTDEEYQKYLHLISLKQLFDSGDKTFDDGIGDKEYVAAIKRQFYYCVAYSDNKFVTSNNPVQVLTHVGFKHYMDFTVEPEFDDDDITTAMLPLTPSTMLFISKYDFFKPFQRKFINEQELIDLNFLCQIDNSDQVYFPYEVYSFRSPPSGLHKDVADAVKYDNRSGFIDIQQLDEPLVVRIAPFVQLGRTTTS